MSKLEKLKEKARSLEAKDPRGAIEAWREVLKAQEGESDANLDLSIFNRIGDLHIKLRDPAQAADFYDQAVDKYAELGLHNNAIAMCNKVLRNAPGRQTTYLKLAKLYASKGFMVEAQQNFVAYAERMHRIGRIQQAFAALKELADISPESAQLRETLEQHLRRYGDPERGPAGGTGGGPGGAGVGAGAGGATAAAPPKPKPQPEVTKSGKWKSSSLVFLDVDAPPASKVPGPVARPGRPGPAPAPAPPPPPPRPEPEPEPAVGSLIEPVTAEPDTSLEIESTNLVEGLEPGNAGTALEGFETTTVEFGDVRLAAGDVPSLRDEVSPDDIPPPAEFEPTVPDEGAVDAAAEQASLVEADLDIEPPVVAPPPPRVKPVVPKRPAAAPLRKETKEMVEVPPLELEPDFDTGSAAEAQEVDDQPVVIEDSHSAGRAAPSTPGRRSAAIDLSLDGLVIAQDDAGSLAFGDIDAPPAKPSIEELEARVADAPDDPEAHQALGESLIEEGERDRGIEELDLATTGFESRGNLPQAENLVEEILRLDPNSVRHRQKQVEFAFKAGDKPKLIQAYLELADTLLRSDLPDKARAVYKRVAEHDPGNERAQAALAMLAPVATPPPPEPKVAPKTKARATEERTAPRDAKMKVRDAAVDNGDFVDLSAMILDDELPERDTRMKVADEEPTGDEERDFQEMLARFKQGIDENIDEGDFQSHYDLGVAFKEMGLLDEAIAELQKALRSPEGRLRSSEALGVCFIEKGAYVVAESILRRALELPASGDEERLGVLYWLGRALEALGKRVEARELYGRVFAVDIRFRDVGERAKALAKAK